MKYLLPLLVVFGLFAPTTAWGANLNFSPASGSYNNTAVFSVNVSVESSDQAMNAVQGVIRFPIDKLQVMSIGQANSIVDLWVQEPKFSNVDGLVSFEGIALNPGFRGSNGKIISITFRARAEGVADLRFQGGQVLANDGKGTSILGTLGTARFTLTTEIRKPEVRLSAETLDPPYFTKITKAIESGDPLIIQGQTYPNLRVSLWLITDFGKEENFIVRSDADGKFTFVLDRRLNDGLYELWAETLDAKDRKSAPSPRETLVVEPPAFLRIGTQVLNYLSLVILIFVVLATLLIVLVYALKRYSALRRRVKKEATEAESIIERQFYRLETSIKDHIKFLESMRYEKNLSKEEEHALESLKKDVSVARDTIQKEVGDITEEVK